MRTLPQHHKTAHTQESYHHHHHPKPTLWTHLAPFPWKPFLIIITLPLALAPIIALATAAERASLGYIAGRACYPNGRWKEATGATWRIMDSSYFFTPNLSFGAMTFTQVKVIDIAWDLVVGRGAQVLLAWVNYRVFNEWLVFHMERHLTSYRMYTAVAFETAALGTLGVLGGELLAGAGVGAGAGGVWRWVGRWVAVLGMLLATLYVLAFPTLMAAMTGYITTYEAYVEDYDNNLIAWSKFSAVWAVVEDGGRVGGYDLPLVVMVEDEGLVDAVVSYVNNATYERRQGLTWTTDVVQVAPEDKPSEWNFTGETTHLDAPTLNITMLNRIEPDGPSASLDKGFYAYDRQGNVYNNSYVYHHASCQPSETYQWGFSYIFLFMVSIFNFVWSCIVVGMWLDTRRGSRMYRSGRRPGLLRSILDISGAIREELGRNEDGLDALEEEELRKRLRDSGGALLVPKTELRVTRTGTGEFGVKRRWTGGSRF